ncbi:coiled-coil domain-containing protein 169-like [Pipistrellus kuhlii]|uniref:coiled-coil domain-containing protein 169-like n=1 Tax=Pipistrellus kuhlii TaxID=59472 RepID=UPI00174EE2C8|nr:coiled-coil domain-containing protein 169-like [Pipistrellus kuhlii]
MGDIYEGMSIEQLKLELLEEIHKKDLVKLSINELTYKIAEQKANFIKNNEWKMRYEIQLEMNDQLMEQIVTLKEKLGKLGGEPSDIQGTIQVYKQLPMKYLMTLLRKLIQEKSRLENQVKYYLFKVEQESRACKKIKDERQKLLDELFQAFRLFEILKKQRKDEFLRMREIPVEMGRYNKAIQKIGNAKKGSEKKSGKSSHLPKIKP